MSVPKNVNQAYDAHAHHWSSTEQRYAEMRDGGNQNIYSFTVPECYWDNGEYVNVVHTYTIPQKVRNSLWRSLGKTVRYIEESNMRSRINHIEKNDSDKFVHMLYQSYYPIEVPFYVNCEIAILFAGNEEHSHLSEVALNACRCIMHDIAVSGKWFGVVDDFLDSVRRGTWSRRK